jgi:hypothetical protein
MANGLSADTMREMTRIVFNAKAQRREGRKERIEYVLRSLVFSLQSLRLRAFALRQNPLASHARFRTIRTLDY